MLSPHLVDQILVFQEAWVRMIKEAEDGKYAHKKDFIYMRDVDITPPRKIFVVTLERSNKREQSHLSSSRLLLEKDAAAREETSNEKR